MKIYRIDCRCCGRHYNSMYVGAEWDITDLIYYICNNCTKYKKVKDPLLIRIFKKVKSYWGIKILW